VSDAWLTNRQDSVLLRDQENSDQLAAIREIARDPALRSAIAANASRTAGKFSWDTHAADLRKLMVKAFEQKRAATITSN